MKYTLKNWLLYLIPHMVLVGGVLAFLYLPANVLVQGMFFLLGALVWVTLELIGRYFANTFGDTK